MKIIYLFPLFACLFTLPRAEGAFKRVCYLVGYNGNSHLELLSPSEMRWHLCTHIIFAFTSTLNGTVHAEPQLVQYIQQMTISAANRSDASNVKFLFSIGGSDFNFVKENDKAISRYALVIEHNSININYFLSQVHRLCDCFYKAIQSSWRRS